MAEQKQSVSGTLPKNIRQIGTSTGSTRVYVEDYVYTYLHEQEEQEGWTHRGFILLGRMERTKDSTRYFISGLIRMTDDFFKDHILEFNDDTWAYIYKEMKKYYDNLEIVGWGQDVSSASASLTAELERSHKQNFNIQKNLLFLLDQIEKEEAFYIFEKNVLQRREGYYVYYEKNPQMQEYMIEANKSGELDISPEEIQEPLVQNYRKALLEKKTQISERKWNGVLYTTSMLLVLSVCVLGVSTVNNVEKMQNLESTVNQISSRDGTDSTGIPAMSQGVEKDSSSVDDGAENGQSLDIEKEKDGAQATDSEDEKEDGQATDSEDEKEDGQAADSEDEKKDKDSKNKQDDSAKDTDSEQISSDSIETTALTEAQTYLLQGYYIVKKGDSLVGISKKIYGTPSKARKICDLNGIEDMDKIYAGQRLELP